MAENEEDTPHLSPFNEEELEYFKNLLLEKRKEAEEKLEELQGSLEEMQKADEDDPSTLTHHHGDAGSDYEEEETLYTLIEQTREQIDQINAALDRIENKTYGICQATGNNISKERLEAIPEALYSVEAKKKNLV